MNIVEAVDATPGMYGGRGRYGDDVPALLGKLYDGKKEGIIVSELSDANHQRNKARDVYADPVEGAYYQDLNTVRQVIDGYTGSKLANALQVRPNDGHRNSYNRDPRGRVYIRPSGADAKIINQDMRDISPIVGQLFDYEY
jgi:hypothetical protein